MKKVIGYIRVSTEYQKLKENSINNQIKSINEYCNRNDFDLVEMYEDDGISGMSIDKREGYKKMITFLKDNDIDGIVVWSLSRLGRKMKDVVEFMDTLKQNNINFFSIKENLSNNDKVGSLIMNILGSINEFEVEVIRERIKDVKRNKKSNGEVYGKLQYGWNNVNGKLVKNESEFKVISFADTAPLDTVKFAVAKEATPFADVVASVTDIVISLSLTAVLIGSVPLNVSVCPVV